MQNKEIEIHSMHRIHQFLLKRMHAASKECFEQKKKIYWKADSSQQSLGQQNLTHTKKKKKKKKKSAATEGWGKVVRSSGDFQIKNTNRPKYQHEIFTGSVYATLLHKLHKIFSLLHDRYTDKQKIKCRYKEFIKIIQCWTFAERQKKKKKKISCTLC